MVYYRVYHGQYEGRASWGCLFKAVLVLLQQICFKTAALYMTIMYIYLLPNVSFWTVKANGSSAGIFFSVNKYLTNLVETSPTGGYDIFPGMEELISSSTKASMSATLLSPSKKEIWARGISTIIFIHDLCTRCMNNRRVPLPNSPFHDTFMHAGAARREALAME
jgi:hypothetical protein